MSTYVISTEQQRERVAAVVAHVPLEPPTEVKIAPHKPKRSTDQNARYWVLLNAIASGMPPHMDGVWHAPEVWHEYCKRRFLGVTTFWMPRQVFGETVQEEETVMLPKSSRTLKVAEFGDYMTEVEAWAAESGIFLDNWSA